MKIISTEGILAQLTSINCIIEFSCSNRSKGLKLLDEIDQLTISNEPYYNKEKRTLLIRPIRINKDVSLYTIPPEDREEMGVNPIDLVLPDFGGSRELYERVSKPKSPLKIIRDSFSTLRGRIAFEYIGKIEHDLRDALFESKIDDPRELILLKSSIKKSPDDPVSQLNLTKFLEGFLLQSASDHYFLDKASNAANYDDLIAARYATKIDELAMPIAADEFREFIKARNQVMHFKTVTMDDTLTVLDLYEKITQYGYKKIMYDIKLGKYNK